MVIFDQLRISDDGKTLYIDVRLNDVYEATHDIKEVAVVTSDKISETNPNMPKEGVLWQSSVLSGLKKFSVDLTVDNFNKTVFKHADLTKSLLYVIVNTIDLNTLQEKIFIGATFDENTIHYNTMFFTRELERQCVVPQHFIDFILLWNAFKISIFTGHYALANNLWKKIIHDDVSNVRNIESNYCCCYG